MEQCFSFRTLVIDNGWCCSHILCSGCDFFGGVPGGLTVSLIYFRACCLSWVDLHFRLRQQLMRSFFSFPVVEASPCCGMFTRNHSDWTLVNLILVHRILIFRSDAKETRANRIPIKRVSKSLGQWPGQRVSTSAGRTAVPSSSLPKLCPRRRGVQQTYSNM